MFKRLLGNIRALTWHKLSRIYYKSTTHIAIINVVNTYTYAICLQYLFKKKNIQNENML